MINQPTLDEELVAELLQHLPIDLGIRLVAELERLETTLTTRDLSDEALAGRVARLQRRDEAARGLAAALAAGRPRTAAAKATATAFGRYLATGWLHDREHGLAPDASVTRQRLFALATWNAGRTLGWRQLSDILDGHRGPQSAKLDLSWSLQSAASDVATSPMDPDSERGP